MSEASKKHTIAVFGASNVPPDDPMREEAEKLGKLLAEAGFSVANGGYSGVMEAVSKGCTEANGHVMAITAPSVFPGRSGPNEYITEEVQAATITDRIAQLVSMSDAYVVLPGSIGTMAELVVAWNVCYLAEFSGGLPRPLVTVGEPWMHMVPYLVKVLSVCRGTDVDQELKTDGRFVACVDTVEEGVAYITKHLQKIKPKARRTPTRTITSESVDEAL